MKSKVHLFNNNCNDPNMQAGMLSQYKLYVEMADKISNRRAISNSFFLGINTALISLATYMAKFHSPSYLLNWTGLAVAFLWFKTVRSYRNLNEAKYEIINDIEQKLPIKPYSKEWAILDKGKSKKKYWPLTHIEQWVPIVFIAIYGYPFLLYLTQCLSLLLKK